MQNYKDNGQMRNSDAHIYIKFENPGIYHFIHIQTVKAYCLQSTIGFDFNEFDIYRKVYPFTFETCTFFSKTILISPHLICSIFIML